jgi:hypothetical protein
MERLRRALAGMSTLDKRYLFLIIAAAVMLPFLTPISFEAEPGEETLRFSKALDDVIRSPEPVVVELAYGNQTVAEMEPIALALMRKLFHEKKPVIFLTLYETAAAYTRRYLAQMEKEYNLTYGEDYVFLGFASAFTVAIYKMGTSIEEVFHEDDRGTPIKEIPIMKGVESLKDVSAVIDIAANSLPRHWIIYGVSPHGVSLLAACTAVQATDYFPFIQSGQIKGLITGGRAGAELETLLVREGVMKRAGDATRSLGSQSLSLLVILGFIIIGNIGYFAGRKRGRRGQT